MVPLFVVKAGPMKKNFGQKTILRNYSSNSASRMKNSITISANARDTKNFTTSMSYKRVGRGIRGVIQYVTLETKAKYLGLIITLSEKVRMLSNGVKEKPSRVSIQ